MYDILFIAHNTHQENYFKTLSKNLSFSSKVVRARFSLCNAIKIDLGKKFEELNNKYSGLKLELYKKYLTIESRLIYCEYKKIIKKYNPKLIGIWNGIKYPQFIIKEFDVKKIYFENGFLPDTTQADCKGVNALNSVPRNKSFYEKLEYYKKPLPDRLIPRNPVKKLHGNDIDLNKEYVFIPLQVNYDSQIIYFSPWINSMQQLIETINDIADMFNVDFIFKAHPSDRVTDYAAFFKNSKKNIFFATNPTDELIKNAKAIITVNSSVGIESLLFGKKVITLGEAFYNIKGIVKHANNVKELIQILKNLNSWQTNDKLIKNFLGYLYYEYLIPKTWKKPDKEHFEKLTHRIKQCLQ